MRGVKIILICVLLMLLTISNIEASSIIEDFSEVLAVGDSYKLDVLFEPADSYENITYEIYDETCVYIDGDYIIGKKTGTAYVYMYFTWEGQELCNICKLVISAMTSGYYRVYTLDENGKKQYLCITDTYPEGSTLSLEKTKYMTNWVDKYAQIWRIEEVLSDVTFLDTDITNGSVENYYTIAPAVSMDTYVCLDGGGAQVFLESLRNCYENDPYNENLHRKWYFEYDEDGYKIKSDELSYEMVIEVKKEDGTIEENKKWVSVVKTLYSDSEKNIVYAGNETDNSLVWHFERVDSQMLSFMQMYDMYGDSYTIVTDRWMGINSTKDLEDLEIFLAVSSSSSTKKEVKWSSSDKNIAVVDELTGEVTTLAAGKVTISVHFKDDESINKSYVLHVLDFEEGIYCLKDTVFNKYLATTSTNVGSTVIVEDSTINTNSKWRIKIHPDGLYGIYLLNQSEKDLFLTLDDDEKLTITSFNGKNEPLFRDTAIWTIKKAIL